MSDNFPSALLTSRQLAAHLGLTVEQVNRLARKGAFPRYQCGHRTYRYKLDEVLDCLREQERPLPKREVVISTPPTPAPAPLSTYDWSR